MNSRLQEIRERQKLRRQLLAQQLGAESADRIGVVLHSKDELKEIEETRETCRASYDSSAPPSKRKPQTDGEDTEEDVEEQKDEVEVQQEEESNPYEEVYKDSSTFLKGTQSLNPHNDYCQHFVDTGHRPQNFIRDVGLADRFEEYPKLRELIRLKDELISSTNIPPMYLQADLEHFDLRELKSQFDVILIEPPLEEYYRESGISHTERFWTWDDIMRLEIEEISALRSFVFLWCGSGEGLDLGRMCLRKWGFRRCEDICWIKTNKNNPGKTKALDPKAVFQRTKEHCLMGIKGTVRRSTDGDFIHANVDIDLIITEEPDMGNVEKPVEIFHIIEHFCLGRRRLHLFGRDSTIRPGWVTVGPTLTNTNFNQETYAAHFPMPDSHLSGCTEEIERLRPKSPVKLKSDRGGGAPRGGRGPGPTRYIYDDSALHSQSDTNAALRTETFQNTEMSLLDPNVEILKTLRYLSGVIESIKKPLGTRENPARVCKDLLDCQHLQQKDDWFWIDPNLGCTSDAFKVFCNFTGGGQTCLHPVASNKLEFGVGKVQMKFLHLLSSEASQSITFHCLSDSAYKTKDKFSSTGPMQRENFKPQFTGWKKHIAEKDTLLEPHVLQDECKIQDGSWHQSHFFFHIQDSRQLPITGIQEFSSSLLNHQQHIEIGPVCFL